MTLEELDSKTKTIVAYLQGKFNLDLQSPQVKMQQFIKVQEEMGELAEQLLKSEKQQRESKGEFLQTDLIAEYCDVLTTTLVMGEVLGINTAEELPKHLAGIFAKRGISE
jgi:NTP pyrophosphatase (non-canonical NTP hydrolase)